MAEAGIPFEGRRGVRGIAYLSDNPDSRGQTLVRLDDGAEYSVPSTLLFRRGDGRWELDLDRDGLRRFEGTREVTASDQEGRDTVSQTETHTVPLVAEEVTLGKATRHATVRLEKRVSSREVTVDEPLAREEYEITRVPVNAVVAEPVPAREENGTIIVPIFEEVLVTEKRLLLREEVHIVRRRVETREPKTVTLRREDVEVRRVEDERPGEQDS
jgi:uncharacterized protein (TIGR02271 family)